MLMCMIIRMRRVLGESIIIENVRDMAVWLGVWLERLEDLRSVLGVCGDLQSNDLYTTSSLSTKRYIIIQLEEIV